MIRPASLLVCALSVLSVLCDPSPSRAADAPTAPRPNILWIIAEDFGPHLGCYGTAEVWTPNLDRLAAEGVRYTRFYTTAPVCSPSRSAFMTGMYQTSIDAHQHRAHRDDGQHLPPGVRILSDWMRDAGYFTANLREMPGSFDFSGVGKTDWNFAYDGRAFDSARWDDLKGHQPFFAQINFQETHRKFTAPPRADPAKVALAPFTPDHPVARADRAAYLDAASDLDRKIGHVLARLKADGLAENTIVIFFGDNGEANVRGKQFCYEEGLHVPLLIRWPAGLPAPKGFKRGSVDRRLIEAIDLAPTMIDIAGGAKPGAPRPMQGRIFLGARAERPRSFVFGARDRCDETVFRLRTVRDDRYRYIRNFTPERPFLQPNGYKENAYPVWNLMKQLHAEGKLTPVQEVLCAPTMPAEELYDLKKDPDEIHNLAADPGHRKTLSRLRSVLEDWIKATGDAGAIPEPEELIRNKGLTKPETKNPNTGYLID